MMPLQSMTIILHVSGIINSTGSERWEKKPAGGQKIRGGQQAKNLPPERAGGRGEETIRKCGQFTFSLFPGRSCRSTLW